MKRIIFITNNSLPIIGATSVCVHNVAKQLVYDGFEVHVVCGGNSGKEKCVFDGVEVHKVLTPLCMQNSSKFSKNKRRIAYMINCISKILYMRLYPMRSLIYRNRLYSEVEKLIHNFNEEIVLVATYTPIEACSALIELKKKYKNVKTCFYSTDTLSNEKGNSALLPQSFREKRGLKWEFDILRAVDTALIMECHQKHYFSSVFAPYHHKMRLANFPLLVKPTSPHFDDKIKSKLHFVYAGTLDKSLRNPTFLCDLLLKMCKIKPMFATFLGGGNCDDIMSKYNISSNGQVRHIGMQPHDVAIKILEESDVLLSIGNAESPMSPSKIYEYMSTGTPIIHTYSWGNDPCLVPLKTYGNALLISEKESIDVDKITTFLNTCRILSFEEVERLFYKSTPGFTARLISNI